jgi:hypothetical protein
VNFEQAVRTAVDDLADEGRPVNLAAGALRRGRRLRLRRRVATGVGVIAAVALLAVPFVMGGGNAAGPDHRPASPPASGPAPASPPAPVISPSSSAPVPGPVQLADGWILGSVPAADQKGVWVYDRTARAYRVLPYRFAAPAPTGNLVAVWHEGRLGVVDLATDAVRWADGPSPNDLPPQPWSPDGTRVVYTSIEDPMGAEQVRLVVVDAATAHARVLPSDVRCGDGCFPTWLPGDRVGIDISALPPQGVRWSSAGDASRTGVLQLPGWVGQGSPWSPDGKHVVLSLDDGSTTGPRARAVVEVATGRNVAPVQERGTVYWTGPDRMLIVTDGGVALVSITGARIGFYPQPARFAGGEWREATLTRA